MPTLRQAKKDRYDRVAFRIRRRWKDAKMWYSAGSQDRLKDQRLFKAVARSAGTTAAYAKRVYHQDDTSRPILRYLHAAVMGLRREMGVPDWL